MYNGQYPPPPHGGFQGSPPVSPSMGSPWQRPPSDTHTPPIPPSGPVWREHQNAQGKKYWFNTVTRQSTWEKPEELLTPEEKALMSCPWKEYKTPEGKTYYSNTQTKESRWVIPEDYKELRDKAEQAKERAAAAAQAQAQAAQAEVSSRPSPIPGTGSDVSGPPSSTSTPMGTPQQQRGPIRQPPPSATLLSQVPAVEFATKEEAEKAFVKLLRETGVRPDWTWEQTMREIITHPMYRALRTAAERKAAFHQYIDREAKRERELREERETKQRVAFFHMLENTKDIKPYTRYRTAAKLLSQQSAFNQVKSDSQREAYFDEYVHGLQRREKDRLRELRKSSMDQFADLLRHMPEITYETGWPMAQELYMKHPTFQNPKAFEGMDKLDFLVVYQQHSKELWMAPFDDFERQKQQKRRQHRKARDAFKTLLDEYYQKGVINARTLWKELYPHIKEDPRYLDLLGIPDSSPLDLFWDMLDDLDEKLYHEKKAVYDVLKQHDFEVTVDTKFEEYRGILDQDPTLKDRATESNIKIIFDHLQNKAVHRLKEEKRRQERKLRKKMDALRYAMKHLDPPVNVEDTWEVVMPRIEHLPEYQAIDSEQARMEAFEKFIKRLKEKQMEQDDEEEEGMIKEEDEAYYSKSHHHGRSHSSRRYKYARRDSDREDELGYDEERRKKRRQMMAHRESLDQPLAGGHSSAEEGEALDDYENDPRRR